MKTVLRSSLVAVLILALLIIAISCTTAKPDISYSPASLSFTSVQGGDNPAIQAIGIWNSGGATLDWSVSDDATWLNLSPTNGSSTGGTSNVIVSVNISTLTAGSYIAMFTISAPKATNNPQTIPVTLTVVAPTLTPEATVKGMFKAMEAKNADKVGSYCTEDIREDVVSTMESSFAFIDSIKITNLKTTVASQTEDTATIDAEWDFEIKAFGETSKEHQSDSIGLVKVDGKWLISEPVTE